MVIEYFAFLFYALGFESDVKFTLIIVMIQLNKWRFSSSQVHRKSTTYSFLLFFYNGKFQQPDDPRRNY